MATLWLLSLIAVVVIASGCWLICLVCFLSLDRGQPPGIPLPRASVHDVDDVAAVADAIVA